MLTLGESAANGASTTILSALPLASGLLGWLANIALILVIGIYLAADSNTYVEGAIRLLPPSRRKHPNDSFVNQWPASLPKHRSD